MSETFPLKRGLEADGVTITEQDGIITSHAPTATMTSNGIVKPDGVTTVVSDTGVISAPLSFNTVYCDSLPTKNISDRTIYFVPKSNDSGCTEYMYINGTWEIIGDTAVDLSGYAKTADLATVAISGSYSDLLNKPLQTITLTQTEYDALGENPPDALYVITD